MPSSGAAAGVVTPHRRGRAAAPPRTASGGGLSSSAGWRVGLVGARLGGVDDRLGRGVGEATGVGAAAEGARVGDAEHPERLGGVIGRAAAR